MNIRKIDRKVLKKRTAPFAWSIIRLLLLIGISYTILYPLLTKLVLVFMDPADLSDYTVKWIPRHFSLDNLRLSLELLDYWGTLLKTMVYCIGISLLQITVTTLAAYSFARYKGIGRKILFALVLGTLVIPPHTYLVTLYTQFKDFDIFGIVSLINGSPVNLLDTAWVFIALAATGMGIRCGLYIYVERQTFAALPYELEEAAKVDGAGMFRTFFSVMLPNAIPSVVLCFILSFVWQWNDTFYVEQFANNLEVMSQKSIGIRFLVSEHLGEYGLHQTTDGQQMMAVGLFLCVIPVVIVFVLCQKAFVQGVERSGLVG